MGYDAINKGSRSAGTIGMHRPRHNDRLPDQARPRTSTHLWRFTFSENSTLVVQQLAFGGVGKIYRTQGFLLTNYPACRQV